MKYTIKMSIKSILFGVDESVIGNLDIGDGYIIKKDTMENNSLCNEFDYTAFGIRRIYEEAKINDNSEVVILSKNLEIQTPKVKFSENGGIYTNGKSIDDYVFELENNEMSYVDTKMRLVRLFSENSFNIKELLINTTIINEKGVTILTCNSKIPFPDIVYGNISKLSFKNIKEIENMNNFIQNTNLLFSQSKYDSKLLERACFMYDQTYTASISTLRFMVGVIGLESLLVNDNNKNDLSYRFARNCAMLLSTNEEEYKCLISSLKKIYALRSEYVHSGIIKNFDESIIIEVRKILRNVIFKIIELNVSKRQLLEDLDLKGYRINVD